MAITIASPAPPVLQSDTFEIQRQKINNLAAAFVTGTASQSSLTTNGYLSLPGGLLMQWGYYSANSLTSTTPPYNGPVVFPIAFPTAVLNIQVTGVFPDGKRSAGLATTPATPTRFQFYYRTGEGGVGDEVYPIYYLAIGY